MQLTGTRIPHIPGIEAGWIVLINKVWICPKITVEHSHDGTEHLEEDLKLEFSRSCIILHGEPETGDHLLQSKICNISDLITRIVTSFRSNPLKIN